MNKEHDPVHSRNYVKRKGAGDGLRKEVYQPDRTTIYTPRNKEGKIPKGSLILLGEIDEEMTEAIFYQLDGLAHHLDIEEITMYLHSEGGKVINVFPIVHKMLEIDKPIKTVAIGHAASGAAFILAAGTPGRRFAYPDARIVLHSIHGGCQGDYETMRSYWVDFAKVNNRYLTLLSEFTGQSRQKLRKDLRRDKVFTPKEARDYGLIDRIIKRSKRYVRIREENGFTE